MSGQDDHDHDQGDGFLRRWSRLKGEDAPEIAEDAPEIAEEAAVAPVDGATPPEQEAEELDEEAIAELPDIETLDKDSDYTGFMRAGVPEALRNRALRKLWLSDPVFANLDGLNDYDENYNLIDKLITAADTNYKVGRGMLSEEERDEEGLPAEEDEDAVEESIADAGENAAAGVSDSGEEEVEREDGVEES